MAKSFDFRHAPGQTLREETGPMESFDAQVKDLDIKWMTTPGDRGLDSLVITL